MEPGTGPIQELVPLTLPIMDRIMVVQGSRLGDRTPILQPLLLCRPTTAEPRSFFPHFRPTFGVDFMLFRLHSSVNTYSRGPWWTQLDVDEREVFPEWFEVDNADDCDKVPESVNTGRPRELCGDVSYARQDT